jgi:hypothetical protein
VSEMLWSKDVAYVRLSDANEVIEERDALKARIAELEAKGRATRAAIGRLDVLACTDSDAIWWEFGGVRFDRAIDAVDAVISAIETPDPRP